MPGTHANSFCRRVETSNDSHPPDPQIGKYLLQVVETFSHPFYVINVDDYTIEYANPAARRVDHTEQAHCYSLFHNSDKPCADDGYECPIAHVVSSGDATVVEHVHTTSKGERNFEIHTFPFSDGSDTIKRICKFAIDITDRTEAEANLLTTKEQVEKERLTVDSKSRALLEVIDTVQHERQLIGREVQSNVDRLIKPILNVIEEKTSPSNEHLFKLLRSCLAELMTPIASQLETHSPGLAPREIEICNMIRGGFTSKQIASFLNIAEGTVEQHRKHIRKKLGISRKDINLTEYLNRT